MGTLACGCVEGAERCRDCRPGLHRDQRKAVNISIDTALARIDRRRKLMQQRHEQELAKLEAEERELLGLR